MKTFNILPKARWLVTITLLLSLCIPHAWGNEDATWTFTSSSYPANNTNFAATGGSYASGSNFKIQNSSTGWNDTKSAFKFTCSSSAPNFFISIKTTAAIPSGTDITLAATMWYNRSTNKPLGSANISVSTNGGSSYNTTGLSVTSWSLSNSSQDFSVTYTTQANIAANTVIMFKLAGQSRSGQGEGYCMAPSITIETAASCANSVGVTKGSESHGEVTTIGSASVATCSGTDSERRVTITVTPDDCYDAPTNLTWTKSSGTVAASKQSGPTDNGDGTYSYVYQFAQNNSGAGTFGVTCTAKAAGKTVNFDAGPGESASSSLTETCSGSGVTLPTVTATGVCKGWTTFAGWATAPVTDSTTTSVTVYAAGSNYVPASNNMTLYAVYSKVKGGGSSTLTIYPSTYTNKGTNNYGSGAERTGTVGTINLGAHYVTGNAANTPGGSTAGQFLQCQGNNANIYNKTALPGKITQVVLNQNSATAFSLYCGTEQLMASNNTNTGQTPSGTQQTAQSAATQMTWMVSGNYTYFDLKKGSSAGYVSSIVVTYSSSATYYCSDPNCCTPLASINGSVNWSNPTTAVVTWNKLADQVTSWALSWSPNTAGSSITSAIADAGGGTQKTATVSGLACGTEYTFTVTPTVKSGVCTPASNPTIVSTSTKYSITRSGSPAGTVTGGTFTTKISGSAVTEACNGSTIQIVATPATGYEFTSWSINSGAVSPAASSASTTFTMPSANVTVNATFSCISPTITADPADATYLQGDTPDDLSVTASLSSGTLSYQWEKSTDGGSNWSNVGTNSATLAAAYISTASTGTTKYRCTVTNASASCSTTSAVATITVNAASYFPNRKTLFFEAASQSNSAWDASACVKAWFRDCNENQSCGEAAATYWLTNNGNNSTQIYAAIIPSTGDYPYMTLQRYASNCSTHWNNNGAVSKADDGGSNVVKSVNSGNSGVSWSPSALHLYLQGSPDSWASNLAEFSDQNDGVWTATYNNYEPSVTSATFKIHDSYNNWHGNWVDGYHPNEDAELSGMIVGSTYNVTATYTISAASTLVMSKTFVKGTVHFDMQSHGSAIADLTNVAAGSKISAPSPAPTDAAYDFGGWYKEPACTNEWNFASDEVNETMTLYAKWTLKTYAITYLPGANGTGSVPAGVKDHGVAFTLSSSTFSRDHYTQDGWSTEDGGAKVYNLGGSYTTNAALTLYPHWTPANYTVTWHVGDATSTSTVAYNTEFQDISVGKPSVNNNSLSTCESNYFVGWVTSGGIRTTDGGTVSLYNDNKVNATDKITGDVDFYAMFATSSGGGGAAVNTVLWAEDFSGWGDGDVPSGDDITNSHTGTTVYGDATLTYACVNGGSDTKLYGGNNTLYAGGVKPELLVGKNTGTFTVSGIPNGGASEITVSYKQSNKSLTVTASGTGYSGTTTNKPDAAATESFDVTVGSAATFTLTFAATQNENARLDDIEVKVKTGGTTYSNYRTNCAACANTVTVSYNAAPTGGTVAVEKGGIAIANNGTVKTCDGSVNLTVTITPASHYTVTGLTAQISSTDMSQSNVGNVYTVTIPQNQTGTLVLTPTLTEDVHKIITWVVHGGSASIADGHGTTWVYSGENLTGIPSAPSAPAGCVDKEFVGWSENDGGATEGDASDYTDLFTTLGGAPTGITVDKTFTAVFATPAAGMGGTVIWDEPFDGDAGDQPSSPTSGATVYGSASIAYNCASTTYCKLYTDNIASGGAASPELLIPKSSRSEAFEVTGIPTAGQTELTLTYMAKDALSVTTGTSGVTVGDASADGNLYTRTITIDQSGLGVATFGLTFAKSTDSNSRLDDIHLVVPGSSSMSGYVTTCEDTWTITYYKNTEDAVTNLPSPTGISKSTGSGTLSSKVPVRYGYTFDGWATSAGGSVAYAAGAAVSSVSADMDLYAKWSVTPVTEINLSKTSLDKYVGDPSVTLSVLSVLPDGANTSVTWSSSNPSVATVNSTTGEVNFVAVGTANIIATSTITSGTTATCAVTVWAKPSVSFLDNLHSLTEDKDGNALSSYNITDVAGTPVVFPVLANQPAGSGTCEDEFYVFIGWTTSDNNTDPEDHLVTSHNLTNGDNITYYAVWADGVAGTTYTKLTSSTFKTTPTHYVLGAEYNGTTKYFYSCEKTDKNNSWGYVTADLANNSPIEFTLSGTAAALVATSTEVSARYLKPMAEKDFQMSASSQTVELKSDGTIYNPVSTSWKLLYNNANSLRWYDSNISGSANAYFYEVVAGGEVNYRTSCCADKVAAPTVTATKTSTTVTLTWAAVSGATGYELQWNGGAWTAATSGVVKSDLTPNTNYSWRVRATYDPPKCGADIASGSTTTNQVYHVTYAKGSGTGSCNATGSTTDDTAYEAGATVTLQSNEFTLVGHVFAGWTEDDEDITISSNQFTMPEHDVVITATWTPKVDKFYDRMHDGTDASHGGVADGEGKYYITREGCSYTVPSLTDNTSGATACHTKHYVLMGWTAEAHLNSDGTLKTGHEGNVYTGGGTQTATGATYYAVWAEVTE